MKKTILLLIFALFCARSFAINPPDEGMWLPMFIKDYNYADMKKLGLKMTPEEMYNINNSSLKDAIVQLGNFCTGELISPDGLMLTNHHCGYASIAEHSSEEHDYLKNGFWAMSKNEELKNEGLTVTFLIRMEDVTDSVLKDITDTTKNSERTKKISTVIEKLKKKYSEDGKYMIVIKPFFEGNEYYMFVYQIYKDVRLVGAPPSGIGKFGGDTDNWMWPRHTGDFSLFRIYTAPDGSPAEYSPDNIPLKPKHYLPISLKGVNLYDYAMIWGFPGTTDRFMTSYEIKNLIKVENPPLIDAFNAILPTIRDAMDASDKVRIGYAEGYAGLANYWKNKQGETKSLEKMRVADKKVQQETVLTKWINQDESRKEKYGDCFTSIEKICNSVDPMVLRNFWYANISLMTSKTTMIPYTIGGFKPGEKDKSFPAEKQASLIQAYKDHMKGTDPVTEEKIIAAALRLWKTLPANDQFDIFAYIDKEFKGNIDAFAKAVIEKSIVGSLENFEKFLKKPSLKVYQKDPLILYFSSVFGIIMNSQGAYQEFNRKLTTPRRKYLAALKEMGQSKKMYPDANSTMRMTYGTVLDYYPTDGVHYKYFTTEKGILEKEKDGDPEFEIPVKLRELLEKKDFGRYGKGGVLPICFLSNNDITGGNSGSPVINAEGHLIGCAFDGNWEALSSNIEYDPEMQRTINVDARYILFVIDKFAGAGYLLDEMKIIE